MTQPPDQPPVLQPGAPSHTDQPHAPHEMSHEEVLQARLAVLRREHRELDEAVLALSAEAVPCALTLQRMKRQKLALKDRIARIEDELTPDIIA